MCAPVLKDLNKRQKDGYKSFIGWYDGENYIYISRNAAKYIQRKVEDSKWNNPFLFIDKEVAKEEWAVDAIQRCYEVYVGNTVYEDLEELSGKNIGCWCKNSELCHGTVLIKLYQEKVEGGGEAKRKKYF